MATHEERSERPEQPERSDLPVDSDRSTIRTYTDRQRKSLEAMTPERRAKVEAIRAELHTPEARARHAAIRERFADRPSREELIRRGEIDSERTVTMGGLAALHRALATLKRAREVKGLSLAEVSRRAGIDPAAMSRLESGRNANPTFETLSRYAAALGMELVLDVRETDSPPGSARASEVLDSARATLESVIHQLDDVRAAL